MNNIFNNLTDIICLKGKALHFADSKGAYRVFNTTSLAKVLKAKKVSNDKSMPVRSLLADSRRLTQGAVFFAVKGFNCDGNSYIEEAIHRGAVAIVSENPAPKICPTTWIQVENIAIAKAMAAKVFYENPDETLDTYAITGTNGKTSVSWIIKHILNSLDNKCGLVGTILYDLGNRCLPSGRTTPDALELYALMYQMKANQCKSVVLEASSHALEQMRIKDLALDCAIFTNLTQDHIDYHKTMQEYFKCKEMLFHGSVCKMPKTAVINIDDPKGLELINTIDKSIKTTTYAIDNADATLVAKNLKLSSQSSTFDLTYEGKTIENITIQMAGRYNVMNTLCALSAIYARGFNLEKATRCLSEFKGVPGRMQRVKSKANFDVFIDYAHTDDALKNGLSMLREVTKGKLLVVFGCGGKRDRTKRPKMLRVVQEYADIAWATSDNPRGEDINQIFDDMREGIIYPDKISFIENRRRAINLALSEAQEGDCILIAGKGHETFQELKDTIIPFDDTKVTEELLELKELR